MCVCVYVQISVCVCVCVYLFACTDAFIQVFVCAFIFTCNADCEPYAFLNISNAVTKLGEATVALGRHVAPHIRKKGEELLPKSVKTEKNKCRMDGVLHVAASGLKGDTACVCMT